MPKSAGGLIGFVMAAVIATVVGLWVINRVGFLQTIVTKKTAA